MTDAAGEQRKCEWCGQAGATEEVNAAFWRKRGRQHWYHKTCLALMDAVT